MSIKFLVVVTGWNWEKYIPTCFNSLNAQTYKNFIISVVDDGSTDNSMYLLRHYPVEAPILLSGNTENRGTIHARDRAIKNILENYDVIVLLDGDDQLLPNALEVLAKKYLRGKWMTYGNWMNQDRKVCPLPIKYEKVIHESRDYRKDTFRCTHLRSFKKELYFSVPKWEITKSEKDSYPDVELLFSMMEMCGEEKIGVVYEPIYIYNETNPERSLTRFGKDNEGYAEICGRPKRDQLFNL